MRVFPVLAGLVPLVLLALLVPPLAFAEEAPRVDLSTPAAIKKALSHDDPLVRQAAAAASLDVQDKILVAPLLRALDDDVALVREAAAAALAARVGERDRKAAAKGAAALLRPLPREVTGGGVAAEALLVPLLHDLAQPVSIDRLLDAHAEGPIDLIQARLMAVANVPAAEAVEALIAYGAKRRAGDGHRAAVRKALQYATGEKLDGDPDTWRAWWREASKSFDFEAAAARRAAAREKREDAEEKREERRRKREEREKKEGEGESAPEDEA